MAVSLRNFSEAGILTHAYLMYAFPTQTIVEAVDALEIVRQMFALGILSSAYWHRFALTVHSDVYRKASSLGITVTGESSAFANNDVSYEEERSLDWMGSGLTAAVYNYMNGNAIKLNVREWFDRTVPRPRVKKTYVSQLIAH